MNYLLGCTNPAWVGDGYCDDVTNNMECNYDGGDCCGDNINTQFCTECQCIGNGTTVNHGTTLAPTTSITTTPSSSTTPSTTATTNSSITTSSTNTTYSVTTTMTTTTTTIHQG